MLLPHDSMTHYSFGPRWFALGTMTMQCRRFSER